MRAGRICSLILVCLSLIFSVGAANAEPSLNAFATIDENSVAKMDFAMRYAEKLLSRYPTAKFEISAGGKGIFMLKDSSPVRDRVESLASKYPNLSLSVCTQTTNKMRKALGPDSVKLVQGATEVDCDARVTELIRNGWVRVSLADIQ